MNNITILLADDDASIRFVLSKYLTRKGYKVKATDNPLTLLKWVHAGEGHVILTDVHMGNEEIFKFIPEIKSRRAKLPIIVISANTRMITALKSREVGVFAYVPKPFDLPKLEAVVKNATGARASELVKPVAQLDQMVGKSKAMQPAFRAISDFASGTIAVFIWGGAGTGKNLAAQCLHDAGKRADRPFVEFAILDQDKNSAETVGSGDLFVDRINELSPQEQAFLLNLLSVNERKNEDDKFRIIASSEISLGELQAQGAVRPDLLSHLMGGEIYLPPLKNRGGDIEDLSLYFLDNLQGKPPFHIEQAALKRLYLHDWPGNIRELRALFQMLSLRMTDTVITEAMVDRALLARSPILSESDLENAIELACADLIREAKSGSRSAQNSVFEFAQEWVERPLIAEALRMCGGNNSKAADLLGIHRNTLRTKLRKWSTE